MMTSWSTLAEGGKPREGGAVLARTMRWTPASKPDPSYPKISGGNWIPYSRSFSTGFALIVSLFLACMESG